MTLDVNPRGASLALAASVASPSAVVTAGLLACLSAPLWAQALDGQIRGRPQPAAPAAACAAFADPLRVLPADWRAPVCRAATALTAVQTLRPGQPMRATRAALGALR